VLAAFPGAFHGAPPRLHASPHRVSFGRMLPLSTDDGFGNDSSPTRIMGLKRSVGATIESAMDGTAALQHGGTTRATGIKWEEPRTIFQFARLRVSCLDCLWIALPLFAAASATSSYHWMHLPCSSGLHRREPQRRAATCDDTHPRHGVCRSCQERKSMASWKDWQSINLKRPATARKRRKRRNGRRLGGAWLAGWLHSTSFSRPLARSTGPCGTMRVLLSRVPFSWTPSACISASVACLGC
jgi:hypothetical protein